MFSSPTSSSSSEPVAAGLVPLHDVVCSVEFIIGTGSMTVRDCLRLKHNSVIPLDQSAGAELEMRVHGIPVATGEVVILDDQTALRVTKILPPAGVEVTE
jgi:flagellar motor switch protein FliN/FliY